MDLAEPVEWQKAVRSPSPNTFKSKGGYAECGPRAGSTSSAVSGSSPDPVIQSLCRGDGGWLSHRPSGPPDASH